MLYIKLLVAPKFREQFKLKEIFIGILHANVLDNELRTTAKGIDLNNNEVDLLHDKVLVLSDHKESVDFFVGDVDKEIHDLKEIHFCELSFDFIKGELNNKVSYLNNDNEKLQITLTSKI